MLRIELTAEDLARVRVSHSWGPLTEAILSLAVLEERPSALFDGWVRGLGDRIGRDARSLVGMVRPFAHVDFHTLAGQATSLEEGLDALFTAPEKYLRLELSPLFDGSIPIPPAARTWFRSVHDGDRRARSQLRTGLRAYAREAVVPHWDQLRSQADVDRALRGRIMLDAGVEGLLSTLHPSVRWHSPYLELQRPPRAEKVVKMAGRSLVLVPSVFCTSPMLYMPQVDPTAPGLLFYPVLREPADAQAVWTHNGSSRAALEALLGRTRAAALEAIADTCTTNELARRIGVSAPTASHHASVLRDAGLIGTRRTGTAVLHSITRRGAQLLEGAAAMNKTAEVRV